MSEIEPCHSCENRNPGSWLYFWIPASAEILLRVIILQLVRFHSINRDEVLRNKGNPS
jgi:hypothetical protein